MDLVASCGTDRTWTSCIMPIPYLTPCLLCSFCLPAFACSTTASTYHSNTLPAPPFRSHGILGHLFCTTSPFPPASGIPCLTFYPVLVYFLPLPTRMREHGLLLPLLFCVPLPISRLGRQVAFYLNTLLETFLLPCLPPISVGGGIPTVEHLPGLQFAIFICCENMRPLYFTALYRTGLAFLRSMPCIFVTNCTQTRHACVGLCHVSSSHRSLYIPCIQHYSYGQVRQGRDDRQTLGQAHRQFPHLPLACPCGRMVCFLPLPPLIAFFPTMGIPSLTHM